MSKLSTLLLSLTVLFACVSNTSAPDYKVYIPLMTMHPKASLPGAGFGGTAANTELLNADWRYAWEYCGFTTPGCTPFIQFNQMPEDCSPVMLFGNEPERLEVNAADAAAQSRAIRQMCPNMFLITGNVVQANISWTQEYLDEGGVSDALGVHCYAYGNADWCIKHLEDFQAEFPDKDICVTEWNLLSTNLNPTEFARYMNFILALTPCSAIFTDTYSGDWWDWNPIYWLVESDGSLNAHGQVFANR